MNSKCEVDDHQEVMPVDAAGQRGDQFMKDETFRRLSKSEKRVLKAKRLLDSRKRKYSESRKRKKLSNLLSQSEEESNEVVIESRTNPPEDLLRKEAIAKRLGEAKSSGLKICIDLSFEEFHSDRELTSLARQLSSSYGYLKRVQNPVALHLCNLNETGKLYPKLLNQGMTSWLVEKSPCSVFDLFPSSELVMLSPDAEVALDHFEKDKVMNCPLLISQS
jgi:tRNA (guanine9-N1)-methyltransferase